MGTGAIVLTEAGGVLNAGLGVANTGLNAAIGNSSENDAQFEQESVINDALLTPVDGPQVAHNGGTAANTSAGTALVASGNASGTGNQSTTDFIQAASVDSDFAVSTLVGRHGQRRPRPGQRRPQLRPGQRLDQPVGARPGGRRLGRRQQPG